MFVEEARKEHDTSKTIVYERFIRFKNGDFSLKDLPHSGRPSKLNRRKYRKID